MHNISEASEPSRIIVCRAPEEYMGKPIEPEGFELDYDSALQ
jgi:hypothetical protein